MSLTEREKLTTDFYRDEFACNCSCGLDDIDMNFIYKLQAARTLADIPFIITSGCRCPDHNVRVGGTENSSHLICHAADIRYKSSRECYKIVSCLARVGFNRIGIKKKFIHVDDDPFKDSEVIWL